MWSENIRCTGFEKEDRMNIGAKNNAEVKVVEAKQDDIIPEGKRYLQVTLSNVKLVSGFSYIAIQMPKDKIPDNAAKITMWIKGNPNNKCGPVLKLGDWSWRDLSFKPKARIDISDTEWVKYEFKIEDFVLSLLDGKKTSVPKQINKYPYLYIIFKPEKEYSGNIDFCIDDIEIE